MMGRLIFSFLLCLSCVASKAEGTLFFGGSVLPGSMITAITEDAYGFVWVGTDHGLARFDGYTFIGYSGLSGTDAVSVEVSSLLCDSNSRLWVGTSRGLYSYNDADDCFEPVVFPDSLSPRVGALLESSDGRLLAGTSGYGLYVVNVENLRATLIDTGEDAYFNGLLECADGSLWKRGTDSVVVGLGDTHRERRSSRIAGDGATLSLVERGEKILALYADGLRDLNGRTFPNGDVDSSVRYSTAIADYVGNIYIGSRGDGLFWLPAGENVIRRLVVHSRGLDVTGASISVLYVDGDSNLWVGCERKGLLVIPRGKTGVFEGWSFGAQGIQTSSSVSSMMEGNDGIVWCAVPGNGIYGFDKKGALVLPERSQRTLRGVESLLRDKSGRYWAGTSDGLFRYHPNVGSYEQLLILPGERVNMMTDVGVNIIAVSTFGAGLCIVEAESGKLLRHLTMHDVDTLGHGRLVNDWIFSMDSDDHGHLWIGTSSGVCCYDVASDSFRVYGWDALRMRDACTAVRVLRNGDVLLAFADGLYRWNADAGLVAVAGTEALHGRSIHFIAEDLSHDLWLSTNDGLLGWFPKSGRLVDYAGGGIGSREFVERAGVVLSDGRIVMGTGDGVICFHPDSVREGITLSDDVHLTGLIVGGERVNARSVSNGKRILKGSLYESRRLRLSYLDSSFALEFSLLRFDNASEVSFEYRFKGDHAWQSTNQGDNVVRFNHLSEGSHELEVRAHCGNVYSSIECYVIDIVPPWWRSKLAYGIYTFLFFGILTALIFYNKRYSERQHDREKLHLLLGAMNADDTPLSLEEMKRAIRGLVESRKRKRGIYGNMEAMSERVDVPEQRGNDELLMDRIMQSVNRHLGDSEFTVEQLCSEAAISRAHLHRKMKELTGLSVTEFIRNIRLEQAARLLREQKLNVTQVAYSVGFSSLGYFATVFRKHFGVSPRDYIKVEG